MLEQLCFRISGLKQWFMRLQSDVLDKRRFLSLLGFVISKLTSRRDRQDRGERREWHEDVGLRSGQLRTKNIA